MSLFDIPKQQKLTDLFPIGTPFELLSATDEGMQETAYGMSHQAGLLVSSTDKSDDEQHWFLVWGTLADQVGDMDDDDLPAVVVIEKKGRKNTFRLINKIDSNEGGTASSDDDIPF